MSTWELLAELPVQIDDYALEPLIATVSSEFVRKSTVIHLRGAGEEGIGEDVTYDAVDHDILQAAGPLLALAGRFTLGSFAEHLAGLSLFQEPPQREVSQLYRTWAYESAALDLALRQAHTTLHAALRARSAARALRRLAAPRRAPVAGAGAPAPGAVPGAALQARPRRAPGMSR